MGQKLGMCHCIKSSCANAKESLQYILFSFFLSASVFQGYPYPAVGSGYPTTSGSSLYTPVSSVSTVGEQASYMLH